jgi:GH25 family lysozyme M1 (1,4-beta-N-acetylmuramidase)
MAEIKAKGIDISKHQNTVDFAKVKKEGFDFCIIRCGYRGYAKAGTLAEDIKWKTHVSNAIAHNVPYGVYFFSQAVTEAEARAEAQYTLKLIKEQAVQPLYPVYIDTEWANKAHTGRADSLTKKQRTAVVKAFCEEIQKNGYYAGIYASKSWFTEHLIDSELTAYDKWVAQYNLMCTYKGAKGMWQYGGGTNYLRSKKVNGVSSDACDQNYAYYDYPNIIQEKGLNGYGKKPKIKYFVVKATEGDIVKFKQLADTLHIKEYTIQEM